MTTKIYFTLIFTVLLVSGCSTQITAMHDPIYQASTHSSSITATAKNNSSGIDRIEITITTGEMTDCTELGGPASVVPCRRNATTLTHTCNYTGSPSTANCTYTQTLGNHAIVSYKAKAIPVSGSRRTTTEITYAGGFPPTAGILRPVWWHRDQSMNGKIDLGFYPDMDYGGLYTEFTNDMENIIKGAYFNSGQPFASTYTFFKHSMNFWAAPFGADAQGCSRSFNALVTPLRAITDGEAIVHKNDFRDCAAIALGGGGSIYAKESDADWLLIHESGHFLHGQGDEYCCDGGYGTSGGCANIFSSQAACQVAAPGHNASAANCKQIGTTGAWRNDDGADETMEDRTDNSNWQTDSAYCITQRFISCDNGNCY